MVKTAGGRSEGGGCLDANREELKLAAARLRRVAGHLRHLAYVDPDRRQDPPRAGAAGQPLVAWAALSHRSAADDIADSLSGPDIPDRLRFHRPRAAHRHQRGPARDAAAAALLGRRFL